VRGGCSCSCSCSCLCQPWVGAYRAARHAGCGKWDGVHCSQPCCCTACPAYVPPAVHQQRHCDAAPD
jgi:hypothetical protein